MSSKPQPDAFNKANSTVIQFYFYGEDRRQMEWLIPMSLESAIKWTRLVFHSLSFHHHLNFECVHLISSSVFIPIWLGDFHLGGSEWWLWTHLSLAHFPDQLETGARLNLKLVIVECLHNVTKLTEPCLVHVFQSRKVSVRSCLRQSERLGISFCSSSRLFGHP